MARLVAPEELTLLVRASGSLMTTLGTDATRQGPILVPHITSYSTNRELKHQTFSTERRQPEVKFTSDPRFPPTGSAVATLRRLCLAYLTSPVKREFPFYNFPAFISFCLQCFVLSNTYNIILSFWRLCERLSRIYIHFLHSLKML